MPSCFPSLLFGSANFTVATTRETWQREKRKGRALTSVLISLGHSGATFSAVTTLWRTSLGKGIEKNRGVVIYSPPWNSISLIPYLCTYTIKHV